ncbi:endonuclease III [Labrys miyagiensis]|uniref:Endonuclease III n=1 Tax=Labrys miyagiensis TaxID=346912 RepID=A0ABQ6CIF5_9HYPH|nr:Fe-S cluster assembly protein HesB [Labrys miyagiensis]GLS18494.1 endonuclease III [Labrys miyagiensis]
MTPVIEQIQFGFDFGEQPPLAVVRQRLLAAYGPQRDSRRHTPPEQFVKALISAETFDSESEKAFRALREHFRPLDRLGQSTAQEVLPHLATVTHPERKAEQLVRSVARIIAERGRFELSFLAAWPVDAAMAKLKQYDGIGPKCAAAILSFSALRRRIFVVDRHIKRFGIRFGLLSEDAGFEKAHQQMMRLIPPAWDADDLYELHWLMKRFGQEVCTNQRPPCERCGLADLCAFGQARQPAKGNDTKPRRRG